MNEARPMSLSAVLDQPEVTLWICLVRSDGGGAIWVMELPYDGADLMATQRAAYCALYGIEEPRTMTHPRYPSVEPLCPREGKAILEIEQGRATLRGTIWRGEKMG